MSNHLQCSPCNVTWCSIFPVLLWQHNFFLFFFFYRVCLDFVKWKFYVYILLLSDGGGRFLVSVHPLLLFSHWFWPSLCYPSHISHLIVIMFLFRSQTPFLFHLSDPFTFLVIRTRVRRPTSPGRSHLPGVNSGGLVILIHIPWYIFCLSLKSRYECWNMLKCGPKSTLYPLHLSSFPFFPLSTCVLSILQLPRKHCPAFPKFKTHYWILASG